MLNCFGLINPELHTYNRTSQTGGRVPDAIIPLLNQLPQFGVNLLPELTPKPAKLTVSGDLKYIRVYLNCTDQNGHNHKIEIPLDVAGEESGMTVQAIISHQLVTECYPQCAESIITQGFARYKFCIAAKPMIFKQGSEEPLSTECYIRHGSEPLFLVACLESSIEVSIIQSGVVNNYIAHILSFIIREFVNKNACYNSCPLIIKDCNNSSAINIFSSDNLSMLAKIVSHAAGPMKHFNKLVFEFNVTDTLCVSDCYVFFNDLMFACRQVLLPLVFQVEHYWLSPLRGLSWCFELSRNVSGLELSFAGLVSPVEQQYSTSRFVNVYLLQESGHDSMFRDLSDNLDVDEFVYILIIYLFIASKYNLQREVNFHSIIRFVLISILDLPLDNNIKIIASSFLDGVELLNTKYYALEVRYFNIFNINCFIPFNGSDRAIAGCFPGELRSSLKKLLILSVLLSAIISCAACKDANKNTINMDRMLNIMLSLSLICFIITTASFIAAKQYIYLNIKITGDIERVTDFLNYNLSVIVKSLDLQMDRKSIMRPRRYSDLFPPEVLQEHSIDRSCNEIIDFN